METVNIGILMLLGIGVFGGILGAWVFQKLRVPQVVGYIVIGILIGESGLHIVKHADMVKLESFNWFALGIIGFLVGGELHADIFRKYGKQFMAILFGEGLLAFMMVSVPVTLIVQSIIHAWAPALASGIVFGAIASATDPASTVEVLWEYRTRGVLTAALIAIVALDDALAMTLYGIGTGVAGMLTGGTASLGAEALKICKDLFGSILLGAMSGFLLEFAMKTLSQKKERMLALAVGTLLLVIGFADVIEMDVILVTMTMGIVLVNLAPKTSQELFSLVKNFSVPIYVMFFVLVGARLGVANMPLWLWAIVLVYVAGRSIGKITGAYIGAKISGAHENVQKYTGIGLFCQGGVAIGLSIMASTHLGNIKVTDTMSLGDMVIFGVTATTLIVQLIGPSLVKWAVSKARETGRNVTEEDVIASLRVNDVMEKEAIPIRENRKIRAVFEMFSNNPFLVYPVTDEKDKVIGVITLDNLKEILVDHGCWDWMVAGDALLPMEHRIPSSLPLESALAFMGEQKIEQVPVVDDVDGTHLAGMLDLRNTKKAIEQELIKRQTETG
ncbi:MAG: cation:proton antiporter [Candidatus Omnitrophica bacterium]|nr:cation:proton antiporter [Candidatus Omnitrophota bacterium]MDD5488486.1 cation:proton antiporter [Candidatus Omnitrophota bacterium]